MAETRGLGTPDVLWLGVAWLLYYALHSALATTWFRQRAERRLGRRGTRLLFVAVSTIGLAALLFLAARLPGKPAPTVLRWPAAALIVASAWLTLAAMARYGVRRFLGLAHEPRQLLRDGLFSTWRTRRFLPMIERGP